MALLQISEPGMTPAPHQRKRAVGIDLGTTNSLVASVINSSPCVLANEQGQRMLPSVVYYGHGNDGNDDKNDDGSKDKKEDNNKNKIEILVGEQAKLQAQFDPINTISSVKRFLGRSLQDILKRDLDLPYQFQSSENGLPQIVTAQGVVNPIQVSAQILRQLKKQAEATLAGELDGVVITVPAYFDDAQRVATKEAAKLAGLNVLRLLNEPTAAAVAYGLDSKQQGIIAVYDLGGGTFDISILHLRQGVFEVLATGGDTSLGGDDFDALIVRWIKEQIKKDLNQKERQFSLIEQRQLLTLATQAKEALSQSDETLICFNKDNELISWRGVFTRAQFEALIQPLIQQSIRCCRRALKDAAIEPDVITEIVMVGGSTRIPLVRQMVRDFFEREVLVSINPDEVVALGAAIQADILMGNKSDSDLLLLDVIPLSLGVETMGGLVEKIIPRNTTIPVAKAQEFTTFKDGQTRMRIHVLQGERELVDDCRSLASFVLTDIPPMVAGAAHIQVIYQVDADGLLSVIAMEKSSGVRTEVQVKPSFGLTDLEITAMLKDSFKFAQQDKEQRELLEQKVDAQRLILSLEGILATEGKVLLSLDKYEQIHQQIELLKHYCTQQDPELIRVQIKVVDSITADFASLRMDNAIKEALTGRSIDSI